jgi:hypothetical protein
MIECGVGKELGVELNREEVEQHSESLPHASAGTRKSFQICGREEWMVTTFKSELSD